MLRLQASDTTQQPQQQHLPTAMAEQQQYPQVVQPMQPRGEGQQQKVIRPMQQMVDLQQQVIWPMQQMVDLQQQVI